MGFGSIDGGRDSECNSVGLAEKIFMTQEYRPTQTPWGRMVIPNEVAPGSCRTQQPCNKGCQVPPP